MKSYYELIQNNIIEFDKLIIEKYHLLGLDEASAIILIKLNYNMRRGETSLSLNKIAPTMSFPIEELSKRILSLVENGFISLVVKDGKESFSLDQVYKRLAIIISDEDNIKEVASRNNDVKQVVKVLEKEFNKILSSIEREIVNKWIYEYMFSMDEIMEAINDALKYKNRGINYIDKVLYRRHNKDEQSENVSTSEIQELFRKVVYDDKK